jgi:hypothetical protein
MPSLKDTELRVLLVLIRQTTGWNKPDRIVIVSYQTFERQTGRRSEAVCLAIRALERRGLIHTFHSHAQRLGGKSVISRPVKRRAT